MIISGDVRFWHIAHKSLSIKWKGKWKMIEKAMMSGLMGIRVSGSEGSLFGG